MNDLKFFHYEQVDSTQDLAKQYVKDSNFTPAVFIANEQRAGYGKRGRNFYSPKDTGIYFSLVFSKKIMDTAHLKVLTLATAVFIVEILERFFPTKDFKLKWVNDIYLEDKKVGGILTEKINDKVIIGVGINISTSFFPDKIKEKAGSICNSDFDKEELTNSLIENIYAKKDNFLIEEVMQVYRKHSIIIGKEIILRLGKKEVSGIAVGVNNDGSLGISLNGKIRNFSAGEVTKVKLF